MESLTKEQKDKIIKEFGKRGVRKKCPMCGNNRFAIADAYFVNLLQPSIGNLVLSGRSIPSIPVVCTNCGFISQHAIGVLGLMPKPKESKKKEEK